MWTKSFSRYTRILLVSAAVIIGAQISISLFESDFRVSIGIFGIFMSLILFGKYPILPVTVISALCVFFSRTLMHWLRFGSWNPQSYFPEMFFYLVYGILFFHYCRKNDYELSMYSLPWMFLFDYLANITELLTRMDMDAFSFQSQAGVLLVALLRTALAGLFLFCLSHYKFSLLSAEHARRYQNLLLLISELNGEVVLMQKGTRMIEDTMSTAYRLYHDMSERNIDESLTRTALQIARDVHEIKKDYNLIVRGLSSSMELNSENDGMSLDDILTILKSSLDASLPKGKRLFFNIQLEENLYTQNHYLLLSIFRNLFNNAIEAADGNSVELSVRQSSTDSSYVIEVEDHGPGIDPEDMEQIFEPGFSTKINYETGEVNRGLGLSLVKDFIELRLGGTIQVASVPGKTVFTLTIPKEKWSGL